MVPKVHFLFSSMLWKIPWSGHFFNHKKEKSLHILRWLAKTLHDFTVRKSSYEIMKNHIHHPELWQKTFFFFKKLNKWVAITRHGSNNKSSQFLFEKNKTKLCFKTWQQLCVFWCIYKSLNEFSNMKNKRGVHASLS